MQALDEITPQFHWGAATLQYNTSLLNSVLELKNRTFTHFLKCIIEECMSNNKKKKIDWLFGCFHKAYCVLNQKTAFQRGV